MAHDHDHHDHDANSYYVSQLCMVGICGALAGVAVVLWLRGGLWFLAPKFQPPVLVGGLALLALVAVRALSVWFAAGKPHAHSHDHDHDHDHDHHHDHEHAVTSTPKAQTHALYVTSAPSPALAVPHAHDHAHEHTHDHGHDHGWAPWRYVVLLLPIVLFFLNLPNQGFSSLYGKSVSAEDLEEGSTPAPVVRDDGSTANVTNVTFMELDQAANSPQFREQREGEWVRIKGQFVPSTSNKRFSLVRFKINCCAADAIRLNMVIDCKEALPVANYQSQWVEVTGQVSFRKIRGREEYITVLSVPKAADVVRVDADPNPFIY